LRVYNGLTTEEAACAVPLLGGYCNLPVWLFHLLNSRQDAGKIVGQYLYGIQNAGSKQIDELELNL
jgi:hypothetical protein